MLLKDQILEFFKKEHRLNPEGKFGRMKITLYLKRNGYLQDMSNVTVTGVDGIIKSLYNEGLLEHVKDSYYYRYSPKKKVIKLKFNNHEATSNN